MEIATLVILVIAILLYGFAIWADRRWWASIEEETSEPEIVDCVRIQTELGSVILEFWEDGDVTWKKHVKPTLD
jgi:hypothetical protein